MYNILVVDDEELIRDGVANVLLTSFSEEYNVFRAENGLQALEIIERENIDAMLLDIKMPKMDGLEVLSNINQKNLNIKTIVLSGYEEFEYAKIAMECGSLNYIVKPVLPKDIIRIAKEIKDILDEENKHCEEMAGMKKQIEENSELIKEKMFNDILSNRITKVEFKERIKFLGLDVNGEKYQSAIIEIIKYNFFITEEKYHLVNYSIYEFMKEYFSDVSGVECFHISSGQFVVIFSFELQHTTSTLDTLKHLKEIIDNKFNVSTSIGTGNVYEGFENIKRTYMEAQSAVRYEVLAGRESVVSISDMTGTNVSLDYMFDFEDFLIKLKVGDVDASLSQLSEMFEKNTYNIDIESFHLFCIKLIVSIFLSLKEMDVDLRSVNLNEKEVLLNIFEIKSYEQIKLKIISIIELVGIKVEEYKKEKKKVSVEKAKNIINQNFAKDISIKFIADQLKLNHNYLGQLFKTETTMSINDYLNKVRVTKAKALLKNTDLMIYEIAEQVGFNDSQYFSTVFKKIAGVSPKDYKEI